MLASTPTSGCSRNSHIRLATATDVATVEEKIVRNDADPAQVLVGEHGQADAERQPERHGDQGELERDPQRVLELVAAEHVDVLVPAVRPAVVALDVAALAAEHDRPASGYTTNMTSTTIDGASSSSAAGNCLHRCRRLRRDATPVTLGARGRAGTRRVCAVRLGAGRSR